MPFDPALCRRACRHTEDTIRLAEALDSTEGRAHGVPQRWGRIARLTGDWAAARAQLLDRGREWAT
ncbi:MAG: hypothetical protein KTR31_11615 [Myxococcales bacterium]|nr:hypothetical protein [Myxococcales bacterium]